MTLLKGRPLEELSREELIESLEWCARKLLENHEQMLELLEVDRKPSEISMRELLDRAKPSA